MLLLVLLGSGIYVYSKNKNSGPTIISTVSPSSITTPASQPLFLDNFIDNSKGWSTGKGPGYSSIIANNGMTLAESNHKILDEALPASNFTPATFTDFMVTTTFTILKADQNDSVGLYLRGDSNLHQGYFVDIFGDNSYDIFKTFADGSKDLFLVSPTNSAALNSIGQQNKLAVVMKGSHIVVFINSKEVVSISDSSYTSGEISLFAENGKSSNGVSVTFRSVGVYPAPAHLSS